ncbi:MAG TPA: NAD(P)H-dependent oxidoreductase subunit E [Tepidisphaeraceae bacterium]|nr:NAD(P)H-dependent oxidoreductase subunit E [Tepidisphaeraceae bacterium]
MAWLAENRQKPVPTDGSPVLTHEMKSYLSERYFPRYPTKRAVLLPALHAIQHEYNWIPPQALDEVAAFLEISAAEVLDTASFYEEYWLKPRGGYLFQVCRSFACEMMSYAEPGKCCGTKELTDHLTKKLGIEPGETTDDKRFTLVELECLGACGTAPVVGLNETLYENVTTQMLDEIIASLPSDPHDYKDPTIDWDSSH